MSEVTAEAGSAGSGAVQKKPRNRNNRNRNRDRNGGGGNERRGPGSSEKKTRNKPQKPQNSQFAKNPHAKVAEIFFMIKTYHPAQINGRMFTKKELVTRENRKLKVTNEVEEFIKPIKKLDMIFTINMKPSDPEFAFDLDVLRISLAVPNDYPKSLPSIAVLNPEIPRGIGYNLEIGFTMIASEVLGIRIARRPESIDFELCGGRDLVGILKTFDKYMEYFLSLKKKDTIKVVKRVQKVQDQTPEPVSEHFSEQSSEPEQTQISTLSEPFIYKQYTQKERQQYEKQMQDLMYRLNKDGTVLSYFDTYRDEGFLYKFRVSPQVPEVNLRRLQKLEKLCQLFSNSDTRSKKLSVALLVSMDLQKCQILYVEYDHEKVAEKLGARKNFNTDFEKWDKSQIKQVFDNVLCGFNEKSMSMGLPCLNYLQEKFFELGVGEVW